jgi:hypothetical protein
LRHGAMVFEAVWRGSLRGQIAVINERLISGDWKVRLL